MENIRSLIAISVALFAFMSIVINFVLGLRARRLIDIKKEARLVLPEEDDEFNETDVRAIKVMAGMTMLGLSVVICVPRSLVTSYAGDVMAFIGLGLLIPLTLLPAKYFQRWGQEITKRAWALWVRKPA